MTLLTGLVSITFRQLSPAEIIGLVKQTTLASIEWGGDIHVPHGDVKRAAEVGKMTRESGLVVSAYGSYYGTKNELVFGRVLDTAVALGAPVIRVWAGQKGSAAASSEDWERIVAATRQIADAAAAAGRQIAFEFHGGTLNDTPESCVRLLQAINHYAVFTYWQPPVGASFDECMAGLKTMLPWINRVHVFHWGPGGTRQPLSKGAQCWIPYFRLLQSVVTDGYAGIEFVRNDDPRAFLEDAETLASWSKMSRQNKR